MVLIASSVVDGADARYRYLTVSSKLEDARDAEGSDPETSLGFWPAVVEFPLVAFAR